MDGQSGFDAVIVCTSNLSQEAYWQARLEATRGQACKPGALVLAVHEDWGGDGAGNGLGTLYAYSKARAKALEGPGTDLDALLAGGGSVALYHTAGKGTRLAPLPGSENNNKPGVKLPGLVRVGGRSEELTILEAVVRQTGLYAAQRPGRLSVFWGDQIFVPSIGHGASGAHHADILSLQGPMPSEEGWAAQGLERYGLIAVGAGGEAAQVEKVDYATAMGLLGSLGGEGGLRSVGPSLGSFSVSSELLAAMLAEFAPELAGKAAKMDSDPHFWMPLTLTEESYTAVMVKKGEFDAAAAAAHHGRMQALKARLPPGRGLFGCIDVGATCFWWDYGMLHLFIKNTKLLLKEASPEAAGLRCFLGIPDGNAVESETGDATVKDTVLLACTMQSGTVESSVCSSVRCSGAAIEDSILINVTAKTIKAKNCVIYNVVCEDGAALELEDGAVYTNVFMPGKEKLVMRSTTDTDGGQVFKTKLELNPYSFNDVYTMNKSEDITQCYAERAKAHVAAANAWA